jgi:hypothetical protein
LYVCANIFPSDFSMQVQSPRVVQLFIGKPSWTKQDLKWYLAELWKVWYLASQNWSIQKLPFASTSLLLEATQFSGCKVSHDVELKINLKKLSKIYIRSRCEWLVNICVYWPGFGSWFDNIVMLILVEEETSLNFRTILDQKIGHSDCLTSSKLRRSWRLNRVAWLMWFFSCVIRSERTTPFLCEKNRIFKI